MVWGAQTHLIPKRVIQKFMQRELNDYRPYAKFDAERLIVLRKKLPTRPPIWNPLLKHQQMMLLLGAITKRFAFHADTGTGKTYLSVALIRYFKKLNEVSQVLVLVPNKTNKFEWSRNVKKHSPITKVCVLSGSSVKKWEQFNETDATIIVETYAGLMRMVCKMEKSKKKAGKHRLKPSLTLIKRLCKKVNGLILDESTLVKTKSKLPFRITRQISKRSKIVFALTGTPFGKDPADLWAQFYLVDGGETLGPTLGLFRAAFFTEEAAYRGVTYKFRKTMKGELHRVIANRSISVPANAADLPRVFPVPVYVSLPKDAVEYAQQAKDAITKSHGNYQEIQNSFLRMRQISSGFLGYTDDELGEKAHYMFPINPKLEALVAKVQEIGSDKIIVFHEYTLSGNMIAAELTRIGVKFVRVYGKTKDADKLLHQFDNDPETQVLLLNNAAGGFGLNLQVARYGMVYESPVSPIMRKQVLARFIRQHTKHKTVFLYDFIVRGTFDQRILAAIAAGRDLFDSIIRGEGSTLGSRGR